MKDDWISAALSDDTVVVELLFRLKQHHPNSPTAAVGLHLTLPLNSWGRRKPRSKPPSSSISVKKEKAAYTTTTTTTRCSPTTPLSWSGGTASPSDDGSDLSSKGNFTYETSNISSSRSKKKRTFTELKEEENLLLKESVHLKRELASVHVNLNEQRARSDNLKRMKFDLNTQSSNEMAAESVSNRLLEPSKRTNRAAVDDLVSSDSRRTENQNRGFFLPDLNAMPSEDEIGTLWN